MPAFLDPNKPIITCASASCEGCEVGQKLHCHFRARDLARFLLNALSPFLLATAGIVRVSGWWLAPWLIAALGYFGFLEIRVMCSHCPHYAEQGASLKCWANYGSPKLWKYRPGPMSRMETFWFFSGFVVILVYPLVFLLIGAQWFLLAMYVLTAAGAAVTLLTSFCSQCMNFACPLNRVDGTTRWAFFERNPTIAQAWETRQNKHASNT
jgi:hypothetical protein